MRANDTYAHPALPTCATEPGCRWRDAPPPEHAARQANYSQHMQQMMVGWATGLAKAIKAKDASRLISVGELSLATGQAKLYSGVLDYYSVHMSVAASASCACARALCRVLRLTMCLRQQVPAPEQQHDCPPQGAVSGADGRAAGR